MQLLSQAVSLLLAKEVLSPWQRLRHATQSSPYLPFRFHLLLLSTRPSRLPCPVHLTLWPHRTTGYSLNVSHTFTPLGLCKCHFLSETLFLHHKTSFSSTIRPAQTSLLCEHLPELPPPNRMSSCLLHAPTTFFMVFYYNTTLHLFNLLSCLPLPLYCKMLGEIIKWDR